MVTWGPQPLIHRLSCLEGAAAGGGARSALSVQRTRNGSGPRSGQAPKKKKNLAFGLLIE